MDVDSEKPPSPFKKFLSELRERKVRKRLAIYLSAGLTILGVVELFSNEYKLPRSVFDFVLIYLLCGIPCAAFSAWIHGVPGAQRIRKREIGVYLFFAMLGSLIVYRTGGTLPRGLISKDTRSIAVLPFVNMSDNKDDEFFSDGVTEDILTQLSKIADLKVISRTSSMQYKNTKKTVREIADELNVAYVLEGSVRRSHDRVHIVGQLIEAQRDAHVWSETYDRSAEDVFAIQSEVAQTIAHQLRATLSPAEVQRIEKKGTTNLDAYALYLRGRDYYYRYTKDDNELAIEMFRSALRLDPHYALAYAGIGDAYGMRAIRYRLGWEWGDSAIAWSTTAISLDPNLAEGYKALGLALDITGKRHEALTQYYRAAELNPNYAPVFGNIGAVEWYFGHYDVALSWVQKAAALQPESAQNHAMVGLQYESLGFDSLARVSLGKALALQPDMVFATMLLCESDAYNGEFDSARARIARLVQAHHEEMGLLETAGDVELFGGAYPDAAAYYRRVFDRMGTESTASVKLAFALIRSGKQTEGRAINDSVIAGYDTKDADYPEGSPTPLMLAQAYAIKHDLVKSAQWLSRGIDKGYRDYRWVMRDPILDQFRSDPAAAELLQRLKTEYDAMRLHVIDQMQQTAH